MRDDVPAVDDALVALRGLLQHVGVDYVLVGGLAVVHHGYVRTTRDIDLLVARGDLPSLQGAAARHGFSVEGERRLRHDVSGVAVDLLFAADEIPPRGTALFPGPSQVPRSADEPDVVALPALVELKLRAGRRQDLADVVGLLRLLDDGGYLEVEARIPPELRGVVAELREEALAERRDD